MQTLATEAAECQFTLQGILVCWNLPGLQLLSGLFMKNFYRILTTFFVVSSVIWGGVSYADSGGQLTPEQSAAELVKQLGTMKSFKAEFHQWVSDAKNATLQEVTGKMWVKRPGQFRWDTNEPYPQQIIANEQLLWIYDLDLDQVTQRKLGHQVGNTPALLLSGDPQRLAESFTISAYFYADTKEWRFDLEPVAEDALFELLRVHFKNNILQDMFLRDSLGQTTRIEFSQQQLNLPIDSKLFQFTPPEGVDVISDL